MKTKKQNNNNNTVTELTIDQQLEIISIQATEHFQENVRNLFARDKHFYEEDPTELLCIEDPTELFEYITNHDYWVRHWSIYLLKQVTDLVFGNTVTD
ncbi:MAG: hypothetical protein HYU68_00410 [Bacteroidetes bacterium]|nr:hypothetical protein [Bacteroidota bacterium]